MSGIRGKTYDEVSIGDTFSSTLTVTETHLVVAAGLFGDFNPLHVDESYASRTRFGGRILHGTFTSALMSAPIGMFFHGTAIAYLEHNCRFLAPVRPGDTLTSTWKITDKVEKPRLEAGIAVLSGECRNQRQDLVAQADGKILVSRTR
jgi:acyl dehydratase